MLLLNEELPMKKSLIFISIASMLFATGCDAFNHKKTMTFVNKDGTETTFEYEGSSFKIDVPNVDGYYYMGGFAENDMTSQQYIFHTGESIDFSNIESTNSLVLNNV